MMSRKNDEPLSLLQATRAHQTSSSKFNTVLWWNQTKTGSNALIPKRTSTIKRQSSPQNKALTSHVICLQKVTLRQNKETVFMHYTTNVRQNKYLPVFPCTTFQFPITSKWSRPIPMIWWIFIKHFFSPFCIPQFWWQLWNHFEISSHVTWRGVYPRITKQTLIPSQLWC